MERRWYIFRDGRALGPYDAREIRESLREGTWDPFDLVCPEGSDVKIPLVEVDEIFASSSVNLAPAPKSLSGQEKDLEFGMEPSLVDAGNMPFELNSRVQAIPLLHAPQKQARPGREQKPVRRQSSRKKRKRDPKRFFLRDSKGRILGPQSAGEIQSLFYKGVLDRSVRVMREGSSRAVPVAKFVTVYSEKRRKKALQGAHPSVGGGMSVSQLHQVALAKNVQNAVAREYRPYIIGVVVLVAMSLTLLAASIWFTPQRNVTAKKPRVERQIPQPKIKKPKSSKLKRPKSFKVNTPPRRKTTRKAAPLRRTPKVKLSRSNSQGTGRSNSPKARVYTKGVTKPPVATKTVYKPAVGPRVNKLATGEQVTRMGPCKYSVASVKACSGACNVTFVGPGGVFIGKFFGDEYKNALLGKGGVAYISGSAVRNGAQVSIIINAVN